MAQFLVFFLRILMLVGTLIQLFLKQSTDIIELLPRSLPVHDVWHLGRTVIVTSTGLDSFPPQSVAITDRTWLRDSCADKGAVLVIRPCWSTEKGWSGLEMVYWQISPKEGEQSLSVARTLRIDSASSPSSTWPEYSSSLHSGIYSFTSFTVTSTSTLKNCWKYYLNFYNNSFIKLLLPNLFISRYARQMG